MAWYGISAQFLTLFKPRPRTVPRLAVQRALVLDATARLALLGLPFTLETLAPKPIRTDDHHEPEEQCVPHDEGWVVHGGGEWSE